MCWEEWKGTKKVWATALKTKGNLLDWVIVFGNKIGNGFWTQRTKVKLDEYYGIGKPSNLPRGEPPDRLVVRLRAINIIQAHLPPDCKWSRDLDNLSEKQPLAAWIKKYDATLPQDPTPPSKDIQRLMTKMSQLERAVSSSKNDPPSSPAPASAPKPSLG